MEGIQGLRVKGSPIKEYSTLVVCLSSSVLGGVAL